MLIWMVIGSLREMLFFDVFVRVFFYEIRIWINGLNKFFLVMILYGGWVGKEYFLFFIILFKLGYFIIIEVYWMGIYIIGFFGF